MAQRKYVGKRKATKRQSWWRRSTSCLGIEATPRRMCHASTVIPPPSPGQLLSRACINFKPLVLNTGADRPTRSAWTAVRRAQTGPALAWRSWCASSAQGFTALWGFMSPRLVPEYGTARTSGRWLAVGRHPRRRRHRRSCSPTQGAGALRIVFFF